MGRQRSAWRIRRTGFVAALLAGVATRLCQHASFVPGGNGAQSPFSRQLRGSAKEPPADSAHPGGLGDSRSSGQTIIARASAESEEARSETVKIKPANILEEATQLGADVWRLIVVERVWLDPEAVATRPDVIELGSKLGLLAAVIALAGTAFLKGVMVGRAEHGQPPVEDNMAFAVDGKLIYLVSGIIWPGLQLSSLSLVTFALISLLVEEMQRGAYQEIGVDVDAQRQRRVASAIFLAGCLILVITPPTPGAFY
eukprot:TRINITY_DN34496_c0_g1_i1.p1 TRINITY_DN34496_c0_g1~~TRINITY_DN34496_c0_g1_i1.p1  ORF type:complete len:256 (-),score=51.68 TRINITY_DN34496_c0_g1_i1:582-1349(-)